MQNLNNSNGKTVICPIYYENHYYGGIVPEIAKFTNIDFGDIRVVYLNNRPYFCLRDICRALEFENIDSFMSYIIKEIDNKFATPHEIGGCKNPYEYYIPAYYNIPTEVTRQNKLRNGNIIPVTVTYDMKYVDEPTLYRIIFKSNKPQAVVFQNWVYNDILPKMRQIGRENTENLLNSQLEKIKNDIISSINTVKINNDQELINLVNNVIYSSVAPNTYLGELFRNITENSGYIKGAADYMDKNISFKINEILDTINSDRNAIMRLIGILYNNGAIPKPLEVVDMQ